MPLKIPKYWLIVRLITSPKEIFLIVAHIFLKMDKLVVESKSVMAQLSEMFDGGENEFDENKMQHNHS